jgi:uncharacterized protein YfaS (alpha-2-macroglobulin family)
MRALSASVHALPRPLADRLVRAALAALTAAALVAAGGCGPGAHHDLSVTTFSPTRTSDGSTPIEIRFDQPVIDERDVGRAIGEQELTLRPAAAWHGHWQDRQTLLITPDGSLAPSTKYTVKLAGLLARRTGGFGFTFVHQPLIVEGLVGHDAERLTTTGPWTLGFSLPVEGKAVGKRCELRGGHGTVALAAVEPDATGTELAVKPVKPLAADADYRLSCSGLAAAAGDAPMPEPWSLDVHTLSNLFVRSALPVGHDVAADQVTLELVFSTPVTLEAARKAVAASPAIPGLDRGWLDGGGTRYRVTADLETETAYTVTVAGLIDAGGQRLAQAFEHEFTTGDASPRLELERGIYALEASATGYPVWSRNLGAYDVECGRIPTDRLVQALTTDLNYDPWGGNDDGKPIGWKELGVSAVKKPITVAGARNKWHLDSLELGGLCGARKGARGVYLADVTSPLVVPDGSWRNRGHRALLNVTDLGVMLKAGPASGLVWVTSLATGLPVAGARVTVYTPQGKAVHTGTTDADGLVRTPGSATLLEQPGADDTDPIEDEDWEDWDSYRAQRLIAVVEKADDVAVVDGNWANGIQIWNFGVPEDRAGGATKIRGFIQSDRGLYRPGEQVHFKGLVRELSAGRTPRPPAGAPIAIDVSDSRGATVLTTTVTQTRFGGFSFDLPLSEDAALGDYYVAARVGTQTFRERFQVEELRPATFEVKLTGGAPRIRPGERLEVGVDARYLFGAPVGGAEVSWSVSRRDHALRFAGFDAYSFDDDRRWWWYGGDDDSWWDVQIADGGGTTDPRGHLSFVVRDDDASFTQPRDYLIAAQVTDAASQTLGARTMVVAHPTDVYLGVFTQEYVQAVGMPFAVNVVAVDPAGARVAQKATLRFIRQVQDCRWDQAGYRSYASCASHEEVALERTIDIPATGTATEKLLPKEPGDYVVKVSTVDGHGKPVVASSGLWVIGKGDAFWSGDESARMTLVASKPSYQIGDRARLSAQAGLAAPTALVTIERDGILDARVVTLASSGEGLEVTIAPDWAPNVFASVVMVAGRHGPLDRDRPMMKMGVVELKVSAEQRRLQVAIATERDRYEPGETVTGTVTVTSAGKPVTAEVALSAADEGVLSLIDYRTPDPMKTFYASFGLGVDAGTNWNRIARLADPGADDPDEGGDAGSESSRVRSRFVASAYWAPALVTDARGVARFSFTAPDSLTAYRLMAVAADAGDRFGNGERRVTVTKQLVAQPVLPRFFTVGDTASLGVIVHNHTGAAGRATIRATTTGVTLAQREASVDVPAGGQATVRFAATVDDGAGSAKVEVAVALGAARDALRVELPIERPRVRTARLIASVALRPGVPASFAIATPAGAIAGESEVAITIDRTGLGDLAPSLRYLIEYPYGCLEQTLSRFVPLAKARDLGTSMRLDSLKGTRTDAFLAAGVAKVARHQQGNGHFSLWPQSETHPHLTTYALWGLREARRAGVAVPEDVLTRGRAALQTWIDSGEVWKGSADLAVVAMAAWLFADAGAPDHGLIARLYDQRATMPRWGLAFLARAMKLAGTDGKQLAAVVKLLEAAVVDGRIDDRYPEADYHMTSSVRASAMTLSALLEVAPRSPAIAKLTAGLLKARDAAGRWESTQDNVWSLIAFADLARRTGGSEATVTVMSGSRTLDTATLDGSAVLVLHASQADVAAGLTVTASAPLQLQVRATDVSRDAGAAIASGFTIAREYLTADGKPAGAIHAGDLLTVRLTVTTGPRSWVALVDHLPAGFEAVNPRLATSAGSGAVAGTRSWRWDHQELRDEQVRWFADDLWASTQVMAYQVRATLPGTFHVAPATIEAMYEPSVMGRTAAQTITVEP